MRKSTRIPVANRRRSVLQVESLESRQVLSGFGLLRGLSQLPLEPGNVANSAQHQAAHPSIDVATAIGLSSTVGAKGLAADISVNVSVSLSTSPASEPLLGLELATGVSLGTATKNGAGSVLPQIDVAQNLAIGNTGTSGSSIALDVSADIGSEVNLSAQASMSGAGPIVPGYGLTVGADVGVGPSSQSVISVGVIAAVPSGTGSGTTTGGGLGIIVDAGGGGASVAINVGAGAGVQVNVDTGQGGAGNLNLTIDPSGDPSNSSGAAGSGTVPTGTRSGSAGVTIGSSLNRPDIVGGEAGTVDTTNAPIDGTTLSLGGTPIAVVASAAAASPSDNLLSGDFETTAPKTSEATLSAEPLLNQARDANAEALSLPFSANNLLENSGGQNGVAAFEAAIPDDGMNATPTAGELAAESTATISVAGRQQYEPMSFDPVAEAPSTLDAFGVFTHGSLEQLFEFTGRNQLATAAWLVTLTVGGMAMDAAYRQLRSNKATSSLAGMLYAYPVPA